MNTETLHAICRLREAVAVAQKANADALWLAGLLRREDLGIKHAAGLTIDDDAIMAANRSLDQTNGILCAILRHHGCVA